MKLGLSFCGEAVMIDGVCEQRVGEKSEPKEEEPRRDRENWILGTFNCNSI
jgi:hypothetical protein